MILKKKIKALFPNWRIDILSMGLGTSFAITIYSLFFQTPFFSKRNLATVMFFGFVFFISSTLIIKKRLVDLIRSYSKKWKLWIFVFVFLITLILYLNVGSQPLEFLIPKSTLSIRLKSDPLLIGNDPVNILWIRSEDDFIDISDLIIPERSEHPESIFLYQEEDTHVTWEGRIKGYLEFGVKSTSYDQVIDFTVNGKKKTENLFRGEPTTIVFRELLDNPFASNVPFIISFFISFGFITLCGILLIANWAPQGRKKGRKPFRWIWLSLPMIIAWVLIFLIFYPGIISNDSKGFWIQANSHNFDDWQSAFYAISLSYLISIWNSPAFISILQIISLVAVFTYGLMTLQDYRVKKPVLIGLSIIIAIYPSIGLFSITHWKDIPYAIAFFLFTLCILRIVVSRGEWGKKGIRWIHLSFTAVLFSIYRHNGFPVAIISLAVLPVIYRKQFKFYLGSLLVFILCYLLIKGPIYDFYKIDRSRSGQANLILLHHIAAHINKGTDTEVEERNYLDSFLPLEKWDYSCCYVGTIFYHNDFDQKSLLSNTKENLSIAMKFFLRDPQVNIEHVLCSSSTIWKFINYPCNIKSTSGLRNLESGKEEWIVPFSDKIQENSKLPKLIPGYINLLEYFGYLGNSFSFYFLPGFSLLLIIISNTILALRFKNTEMFLIGMPIYLQAGLLTAINFAPVYRYNFNIILLSILFLGLLFIPYQNSPNGK